MNSKLGNVLIALAVILVLPVLLGKWANHFRPDLVPPALFLVAGLLFAPFNQLTAWLVGRVRQDAFVLPGFGQEKSARVAFSDPGA